MKMRTLMGVAAGVAVLQSGSTARAERVFLTNGTSITTTDTVALATATPVVVAGMQPGETLVGIDVRPNSPGTLYGVGSTSRVYTIDPTTGLASAVGTAGAFALNGTFFGTDFNPIPDLIRQVSNTEQNLRINPNTGALTMQDTGLTPAGNIVGVAYDRNFPRAGSTTPTTLYGIDSAAGTLVTIGGVNGTPSPNGGAITIVGSLGLGTNLNEAIGFDISGATGIGFASITTGGVSRLYTLNLSTGAATPASSNGGTIGTGATPFLGLAAAVAPEPGTTALLGVGSAGLLLRRRTACRG